MAPTNQTQTDAQISDTEVPPAVPEQVENPTEAQKGQLEAAIRSYVVALCEENPWLDDVLPSVCDVEVTISTNSQRTRRAADARAKRTVTGGDVEVKNPEMTFTWAAYVAWGWGDEWTGAIRHELVHLYEYYKYGESDHSNRFKCNASKVDAPVRCPSFVEEKRYTVKCGDGCEFQRSKASSVVKEPIMRRCGEHGNSLRAIHNATGKEWHNEKEYKEARRAVKNDPEASW